MEVYDRDGKVIAIIHDTKALSELLDYFEKQKYIVDQFHIMQELHTIFGTNDNMLRFVENAAEQLRAIRKRFGDNRENLYPVEIGGKKFGEE